jgi:hypothetical protein
MPLDGKTFQQIHDALLDSFFNKSDLAQMVKRELGEDLDDIAGGENFKEVTFNLLRWAETRDKVDILLEKAREYNPNNRSLRAVSEELPQTPETSSFPVVERARRKIGMWLGLAVLLVVLVFAGKLLTDRFASKNGSKSGTLSAGQRSTPLTEAERKEVTNLLKLTEEALEYDDKEHLAYAESRLAKAEAMAPDDPEVKKWRGIVDKKRE